MARTVLEEYKHELCKVCGADCWQYNTCAILNCKYTRENKQGAKLADKLYKEFAKQK